MPLPIALTLISGVSALISAFAALWVTPWTMRAIADQQTEVGRAGIAVAADSAAAAAENAKAAARNAEVAARNSENLGIHQVARLRQEWINTVREELAQLHAELMNWRPLRSDADSDERADHFERAQATSARIAKVKLLLNPGEVASQNVLNIVRRFPDTDISMNSKRPFFSRWLLRWSQIVLKTEWDRVRGELHGHAPARPKRRGMRR